MHHEKVSLCSKRRVPPRPHSVIGAMAVLSYVPYRTTRDLDVLIEPTLENGERVWRTVARWAGAR